MLTAISTAYGKLISNYTTNSSTIQYFEPPRSIFLEAHFIRIYCQLYTPNYQKIFLQTVAYVRCIKLFYFILLEFCAENGKEPQQQYKGSFNVRITADLHRKASLGASAKNISLNSYVEQAIEMQVAKDAVAL